jgi:anaerobic magnesium-protoporphyrin IX monomethyl ester cyclase
MTAGTLTTKIAPVTDTQPSFSITSLDALRSSAAGADAAALGAAVAEGVKTRAIAPAVYADLVARHGDVLHAALDRVGELSKGYATRVNVESLKELMGSLRFVRDNLESESERARVVDTFLEIQSRVSFFEREYLFGKATTEGAKKESDHGGAYHVSVERVAKGGLVIPKTRRPRTILLLNPSQESVYGQFAVLPHPSLGLLYIGTALSKAGHKVSILDADSVGLTRDGLMALLKDEGVEIVGVITVTPIYNKVVQLCAAIKEVFPQMVTVIGGIHPTVSPAQAMQAPAIDFAVKGEGEQTMLDLVEALNGDRALADIPGLLYREEGKVRQNRERPLIDDLDSIPVPDWSLLRKGVYSYPDALHHPAFPVFTSRGCPSRCIYCQTKNMFTLKFRTRSAANVVDEIEHLVKAQGAREIHIWDDVFTANPDRVFAVRDEMKRRGLRVPISFPNGMRADQVSPEILRALKEMGAYSVAFGIETGSAEIMERIRRGLTKEEIVRAVGWAKAEGLETWGFFLIGLPTETKAQIEETIAFARFLDLDVAKFHVMQPYPGSTAFFQLEGKGLIQNYNYDQYGIHTAPVHRLDDLTADEILEMQRRAYRRFYLRPRKIFQHALRLKSFHRLKINLATAGGLLKLIFSGEGVPRAAD